MKSVMIFLAICSMAFSQVVFNVQDVVAHKNSKTVEIPVVYQEGQPPEMVGFQFDFMYDASSLQAEKVVINSAEWNILGNFNEPGLLRIGSFSGNLMPESFPEDVLLTITFSVKKPANSFILIAVAKAVDESGGYLPVETSDGSIRFWSIRTLFRNLFYDFK
jgi:hypothetical protein